MALFAALCAFAAPVAAAALKSDAARGELDVSGSQLERAVDSEPKGRHLIFTSAGDNSGLLENWVGPNANYDIFLVYYGKNDTRYAMYERACRWTTRVTGSKLQNLNAQLYQKRMDIFLKSDYVFVLDDDFMFDNGVKDINKMFEYSRKYNLKISMPSVDASRSVLSHFVTAHQNSNNITLAYTNFLEVNSMLFTQQALRNFLEKYDPSIIGFGGDYLAFCANGYYAERDYAVIHEVVAVNPRVRKATGKRELHKLKDWDKRAEVWHNYAKEIGCKPVYGKLVYSVVRNLDGVEQEDTCVHKDMCQAPWCFDFKKIDPPSECEDTFAKALGVEDYQPSHPQLFVNGTLADRWWTRVRDAVKLEYGA